MSAGCCSLAGDNHADKGQNLAAALAASGASVGLLDADIYGPSQGALLGLPEGTRPDVVDELLQPVKAHGIAAMSMGFVTSERTPAIWRGPMASGALQQLLTQTHWGELDYLIVDMPPGTGDIQLTLAQRVPLTGAVIVLGSVWAGQRANRPRAGDASVRLVPTRAKAA